MRMWQLNIKLNFKEIERIKELSSYNDNYYKVVFSNNDVFTDNDIVHEICYEDDGFKLELGHIENGKFKSVLSWIENNPYGIDGIMD